jgi:hypothetical protein
MVAKVIEIVFTNARYTTRHRACISLRAAHTIFKRDLKVKKSALDRFPVFLKDEQKKVCVLR